MTEGVEYRATIAGFEGIKRQLDEAARIFVSESTADVTRAAQVNANTGAHSPKEGHLDGTGPGPNVVTGTLRRSIKPDPVTRTSEGWRGTAGPHTEYARAVELGHPNWGGRSYPYLGPAIEAWKTRAKSALAAIVNREVGRV